MERKLVIERLNWLVLKGVTFKEIEVALKMPKNCLSRYASGNKQLPEKWIKPLADHLEFYTRTKVVLIEDEDGKFLFMNPDGTTRKCTLVWEDEQSMIDGSKVEKCDKIRIKINTVNQEVPEKLEAKYDFGDAKFLIVENFTKYPLKDKPKNIIEAAAWVKEKSLSDAKIKDAWNNR